MEQKAFDYIKHTVAQDTLLSYLDFNKCFDIHTYDSDYQLLSVIIQDGKHIALYSRKLNETQMRYTITEKEWLSIVKTLKEFRTILLGQQLKIFTEHKNPTCKFFNNDRVLRWILILEEHSPEIEYTPDEKT